MDQASQAADGALYRRFQVRTVGDGKGLLYVGSFSRYKWARDYVDELAAEPTWDGRSYQIVAYSAGPIAEEVLMYEVKTDAAA